MKKKFLGFGFGPIQMGLFLHEAMSSGNFDSFMVAEIDQELVDRVRANGNSVAINVARSDGVQQIELPMIQILNPLIPEDRKRLARGVAEADEMATAVPNVDVYAQGGEGSIAHLVAESISMEKPQILYAAENNNYAAEILRDRILKFTRGDRLQHFQILNTVIAKMSGTVKGREEIDELGLAPLTPDMTHAVLVEEFNRILVSKVYLPGFVRGIEVFEEKANLLPYGEVKFFGHNAIHAMLGYLAYLRGYEVMSQIGGDEDLLALGREALIKESGAALIKKYGSIDDPLFTKEGFEEYAKDLLARIVNPYLNDRVMRICRDPVRKLGYSDRLFGIMREALRNKITPWLLAQGALAALKFIILEGISVNTAIPETPADLDDRSIRALLEAIWEDDRTDEYREDCIRLIVQVAAEQAAEQAR
jgi:mannitol-1-phosphate 5-dehydrogenase